MTYYSSIRCDRCGYEQNMSDEKGYDMARSWLDLRARADGATPGNLCKECWRWITAHTPPRGTEMKSDTAL